MKTTPERIKEACEAALLAVGRANIPVVLRSVANADEDEPGLYVDLGDFGTSIYPDTVRRRFNASGTLSLPVSGFTVCSYTTEDAVVFEGDAVFHEGPWDAVRDAVLRHLTRDVDAALTRLIISWEEEEAR